MLRIKDVKKLSEKLGFPAGKEVHIHPLQPEGEGSTVYVKYGRELSKHDRSTSSSSTSSMDWNVTLFDTALNLPGRRWTVMKNGDKTVILAVGKKGLGFTEDDPPKPFITKYGNELEENDYSKEKSVIFLVHRDGKEFAVALDDTEELNLFTIDLKKEKLSMKPETLLLNVKAGILPVEDANAQVQYVAVNDEEKSVILKMNDKKSSKIDFEAVKNADRILITKNKELLHISAQGLNVYSIDDNSTSFKYYCPQFSKVEGWSPQLYQTVSLMSVEEDQEALIGTGPKGIEYMPVTKNCRSYVTDGTEEVKHALIAVGVKQSGNDIKVVGFYNGELCELTLEVVQKKEVEENEPKKKEEPIPNTPEKPIKASLSSKIKVRREPPTKSIRWLRDSLDEASFKNIINKLTGKAQFAFPLVDLQDRMGLPIKLMVYYQETDSEDMSVLGRHWSLSRDCIVLDHGNTVFEDTREYYLVKDQMRVKLNRDWSKSGEEGKASFYIVGTKNVTFEYTPKDERWEASDGKIRYVYGVRNQGAVTVPGWDDWYGPSAKYDQAQSHGVQWNLVEIGSVAYPAVNLKYSYTELDNSTNTMHLQRISDGSTNITFSYRAIEVLGRQVESELVKEHRFINNNLLEKVKIESPSISQVFNISCTEIDSLYYLESVYQEGDPEPVLSFQYYNEEKLKPRVQQIQLPSKAKLHFEYTKQNIPTSEFVQEIDKLADLYTGNEYSLEVTKNKEETILELKLKDSAGRNNFVKDQIIRIESYNGYKIKTYSPFMKQSYIALVVSYIEKEDKIHTKIYILNNSDGDSWKLDSTDEKLRVSDDNKFKYDFQDDSFVYYHSNKVHFEYKKSENDAWSYATKEIPEMDALTLINRGAIYCKDDLVLVRWDAFGNCKESTLSDPESKPVISDVESFFEHIDIQGTDTEKAEEANKEVEDYKRDLKDSLNDYGLVLYNNVVALRTLKLDGSGEISVKVFLYLLQQDYTVSNRTSIELKGDDISKFNLTLDVFDEHKNNNTNELDKYLFKFQKETEVKKYKLKFVEATDKTGKKTEPSDHNQKLIEQYQRRMKIPLDFEKYMMQVNHDGIIINDHQIIHDDGKFVAKPLDRDTLKLTKFKIPLGTFSNFKKDSEGDEVKLCTKTEQNPTETCVSLVTTAAQNVSIKYPYYLVTQIRNDIKVLPLKDNGGGLDALVDYNGEILHGSSSHAVMVTTRISDNKTIVRPMKALNKKNITVVHVISMEHLTTPFDNYQIKYEYYDPVLSVNEVAFKSTIVVPGGNKSATGYYNETNILQANQQIVQVMTANDTVFDPEYVKRMNEMQQEEEKQRDQPQPDEDRTVSDKSGYHPLLKTTPYRVDQKMVHFVGFEDYEDLKGWKVDEQSINNSSIRRNEFSATGRNFLLLKKGEVLTKEVLNTTYYDYFITSAWIRTEQELVFGNSTEMIAIYVDDQKVQGTIKQTIDEWVYIEADTRSVELEDPSSAKEVNLKVIVKATGDEVHVDHVRLSPMNFNFEANMYDSRIGQRTAQIHTNGLVSRRLYDTYNRRIAEIDESGNIEYLASYSKRVGNKIADERHEGGTSSRIQIRSKESWLESFSPYTMKKRWTISGDTIVEPYKAVIKGTISFNHKFSSESICIRLIYDMDSTSQLQLTIGEAKITVKQNSVEYNKTYAYKSSNAELVVFATPKLTSIWVDGHLAMEKSESFAKFNNETVSFEAKGSVEIRDLTVMDDAEIQVSYLNHDSKPIQEIILADTIGVLIRQMSYDVIGRKVAETVWTRKPLDGSGDFTAFQYHADFVANDDPTKPDYFLKNGEMEGLVANANKIYEGFPYKQIEYYPNPLEIRQKLGQPGKLYSISGNFSHEYSIESDLPFIKKNFPQADGYRQEQESKFNGKKLVVVYNRRNKKVAEYTQVQDYNNILTTYVYDAHGNQIQMLPPNFYAEESKNGTNIEGFNPRKGVVESPWAVNCTYDSTGELITSKITPDGGRVDFIYNEFKQLRYQMHYDEKNKVDKIAYFVYNVFGRVCEAGLVRATPDIEELVRNSTKINDPIPDSNQAVLFDYGETEPNPLNRGRIQRTVKRNNNDTFSEVLYFDEESRVVRKSYFSPVTNDSLSVEFLQENDKVGGIQYPFAVEGEQLVLKYKHNLRGDVVQVSRMHQASNGQVEFLPIAGIEHDAEGKITKLSHLYGNETFVQNYKYEAPGYLVEIANDFLTEKLYYTEKGYGCKPTGDGSILRTEFNATWHDKCNQNLIPLTARAFVSNGMNFNTAELCFDALFKLGYIDTQGRPVKTYYPDLETKLPAICAVAPVWQHLSEKMLANGYPVYYGHAYDYGSHGELVAAKSFIGHEEDNLGLPLTKEVLSATGLETTKLEDFWDKFTSVVDKIEGTKALFAVTGGFLEAPLGDVIHRQKLDDILNRNTSDDSICSTWMPEKASNCKTRYQSLYNYLNLKDPISALEESAQIKVLEIMKRSLGAILGNSPGDVESFSMDSNGNHGVFYTGFKRYELKYKPNKNQITTIKEGHKQQEYTIEHDSEGNIVKALHKNIQKIEYDPLTQRVSRIELTNQTLVLELGYDFRGERTLKRVRNKDNELLSELYYVRDHKGNVLVEYKLEYPNPKKPEKPITTVTAYVQGPLGLLGFFRNNKYYSVLLDHEGSTRLVVHRGKVVAAYDYLPYGQLIRKYGSNPEAHITFRYTGQEFDEETGLYNYHARLYDPDIGRFFQMDPMEQYSSPYKYAGNSPVSQIDPDGQIAVTVILMIVGAIVGAYMGAASANNSWNPAKWDWANKKTWIGMFAGAAMGAFAMYGGAASFSYFTTMFGGSMVAGALATGAISVAGAFLGAAAASNEWNPAKWDWTSPVVWNGLITGASVAVSFPSGFYGISRTFLSISSTVLKVFYGLVISSGFLLFVYLGGAMGNNLKFDLAQWDWKSPRTWFGVIEGASTIFMSAGMTAKHGAAKVHHIVKAGKTKIPWYRINIPKESYTLKFVMREVFVTYYRNGQRISKQVLKVALRSDMAKIPKEIGMTKAFFMPIERIGFFLGATPVVAWMQSYKTFFQYHPNGTWAMNVKRRRRSTSTASSSAAPGISSFLNEFFEEVSNFFKFDNLKLQESVNSMDFPLKNDRITNEPSITSFQKLCYAPTNDGNQIICPQRESTVNIFSKSPTFNPELFGQDRFRSCLPLTWQDRPSVACDGDQTTFIYTPVQRLRVFDMVDGWLLLARVAPAAVRSLKEGFHFLTGVFTRNREQISSPKNLDCIRIELEHDLNSLKKVMNEKQPDESKWAEFIMSDLEDDVKEFVQRKNPTVQDLQLLQERLSALREELTEDQIFDNTEGMSSPMADLLRNMNGKHLDLISDQFRMFTSVSSLGFSSDYHLIN